MLGQLIFFGFIALTCLHIEAGEYHTSYIWCCSRCGYAYDQSYETRMPYIMRNECQPMPGSRNCADARGDTKCTWVCRGNRIYIVQDEVDQYNKNKAFIEKCKREYGGKNENTLANFSKTNYFDSLDSVANPLKDFDTSLTPFPKK